MLSLTAAILLGGAISFLIVNFRYPLAIKRSLILFASANVAIAIGCLISAFFAGVAPQPSQIANLAVSGLGTCLYYFAYRSLQERSYHPRMVFALYAIFLAAVIHSSLVAHSGNRAAFAICALDIILFGLSGRDLLVNFPGRGLAHLIQGIAIALFTVFLIGWGALLLMIPPAQSLVIHFGEPASYGLAAICIGSALGQIIFLLMCNDEFNSRLLKLVSTDPLTGLANRRQLMERGAEEIARARRFGHPITALMVDLDHFKVLNDTHGHAAGDRALIMVAATCLTTLRDIDLVARSGGEEFAILLPETGLAEGLDVAERLCRAIHGLTVPAGATAAVSISASIGVAELSQDDVALDQVLARADRALYRAKAQGRNRVSHEAAEIARPLPAGNAA